MYDEGDRRPDAAFWQTFLTRERLPELYRETAETWFSPLVEATWQRHCEEKTLPASPPQIIGIHGCQGSGKSTLAALVEAWLTTVFGLSVLRFSIDDFYLTKHDRQSLAENIHPLFATRGVPGTHDIGLLEAVMRAVITRSVRVARLPQRACCRRAGPCCAGGSTQGHKVHGKIVCIAAQAAPCATSRRLRARAAPHIVLGLFGPDCP